MNLSIYTRGRFRIACGEGEGAGRWYALSRNEMNGRKNVTVCCWKTITWTHIYKTFLWTLLLLGGSFILHWATSITGCASIILPLEVARYPAFSKWQSLHYCEERYIRTNIIPFDNRSGEGEGGGWRGLGLAVRDLIVSPRPHTHTPPPTHAPTHPKRISVSAHALRCE